MPDCPPALRGQLYSTHLTQRCPEYTPCRRCLMCSHYDRHSLICQHCEGSKPGRKHDCRPDQILGVIQLEELMGRPLFDVNADITGNIQTQQITSSAFDEGAALVSRITEEG